MTVEPNYLERLAALESNFRAIDRRVDDAERGNNTRHEDNRRQAQANKNEIIAAIGKVDKKVDVINGKVDTLWDDKNKRDGALGASKFIAGGIGGLIVALIDWGIRR